MATRSPARDHQQQPQPQKRSKGAVRFEQHSVDRQATLTE